MTDLTSLTASVTKIQSAEQSAVALIKGLSQQIKDAGTDATALSELTAKLDSTADELGAAVVENTPSA